MGGYPPQRGGGGYFRGGRRNGPPPQEGFARSKSMPTVKAPTDEEIEMLFQTNKESAEGPDVSIYESAEVEVKTQTELEPINDFPRCGIRNEVLLNVAKNGYKVPTPVQRYSIPYTLAGEDLIVTSQTGSGKTAAFMLPVITQLIGFPRSRDPSCVVLCPTRELAIQIFDETRKFCRGTEIKTTCVFGGSPINEQIRNLNRGIDIVIATPGRLIDIMKSYCLTLSKVRFLILDEADRMLDMGFEPQIREVINGCDMPPASERQTMLFSATFPVEVQRLARDFMRPKLTRISVGMQDAPKSIEQRFIYCRETDKFPELLEIIHDVEGPTLVFAERKASVDHIEQFLYEEGTNVVAIHGDRQMNQRLAALDAFTNGHAKIMVATDVAARGLDISNVTHVINLDLPTDLDTYTHRIGRTGRAGKHGRATSFFNENNKPFLIQLVSHLRSKNMPLPSGLEEYEASGELRSSHGYGRGGGRSGGMSRSTSASGYGGGRGYGGGGYGGYGGYGGGYRR
jgi:ATP-dependent RNA helicase DDX3X